MKIYLPWKLKGPDGRFHRALIEFKFEYRHSQYEDMQIEANKNLAEIVERAVKADINILAKKSKSGLRKCLGHKKKKPEYDEHNQCSICGGFKREK